MWLVAWWLDDKRPSPPILARETGGPPVSLTGPERSGMARGLGDGDLALAREVGDSPLWLTKVKWLLPMLLTGPERSGMAREVGDPPLWLTRVRGVRTRVQWL